MKVKTAILAVLLLLAVSAGGWEPAEAPPAAADVVQLYVRSVAAGDAEGISESTGEAVTPTDASGLSAYLLGHPGGMRVGRLELGEPLRTGREFNYLVRVVSADLPDGEVWVGVTVAKERGRWLVVVAGPADSRGEAP